MKAELGRAGLCLVAALATARAQRVDAAQREVVYAESVASVADSAIHRLDFFPERAQLRVQMLFLAPSDSAVAVFHEIGRLSGEAAERLDQISTRFADTAVPEDLRSLHADLLSSLRAARAALDRLGSSATSCQLDPTSVTRCQASITSASTAIGRAYSRYLDVRARIREQIADTRTVLPEFALAARSRRAPELRRVDRRQWN